jgi:hypothetical protein
MSSPAQQRQQQQHQFNVDSNANTTNVPTLTTYPLLLKHLHAANAFAGSSTKDLPSSTLIASSLSNREHRDDKQYKSQMLVSPPKADLYKTKVQQLPSAMGVAAAASPSSSSSSSLSTKQKLHKTDAPMLNYIFDSHAPIKKHNHNFR